jgi:hypothetical protein
MVQVSSKTNPICRLPNIELSNKVRINDYTREL